MEMVSNYISLFKLRIAALLVFVAVVSAIAAGGGSIVLGRIAILVVAGTFSCIGAACLNNYFDRDIDGLMDRNKHRPLPAGKIKPVNVLYLGLFLILFGVLIALKLNYLTALFIFLGAFTYIAVYTLWLKRRSSWNIVIGGFAGSCASLAGWAAIVAGKAIYEVNCMPCHGSNGKGVGLPNQPDLTNAAWWAKEEDSHLFKAVSEGVAGTAMVAWKDRLTPDEIWKVLAYEHSMAK